MKRAGGFTLQVLCFGYRTAASMAVAIGVGIMPAIALILVLRYGDKKKTTVTNVLTIVRPTFAITQNLHPTRNLFHSEALKNVPVAHKEFHQPR